MLGGARAGRFETVSADNELGTFLRTRREAVSPAEVGLPAGSRRRTPGLRRSELATLAGVSVEYLTRLEQGRDRNPSAAILGAIADALRLSGEDRFYLRLLGKVTSGHICTATDPPASTVRPTVRAVLATLEPAPALVLNRMSDVIAFTDCFALLAGPSGLLDDERPNLARYVFTDARAKTAYADWDSVADQQVANLKIESYWSDPHVAELADELTVLAGAPFTSRWQASPGALPRRTGVERLVHPEVGELRLAYETLELPDADDQRLVVYVPADEAASAGLDRLTRRQPGALRAVTG